MSPEPKEPKQEIEKNDWQDETAERAASVNSFIVENFFSRGGSLTKYHASLHLSGGSWDGLQEVAKGEATQSRINVHYGHGVIEQIHVIYNCEGGQSNDFYLTGKALEDYLSGE